MHVGMPIEEAPSTLHARHMLMNWVHGRFSIDLSTANHADPPGWASPPA
jgi:hypothetical protein